MIQCDHSGKGPTPRSQRVPGKVMMLMGVMEEIEGVKGMMGDGGDEEDDADGGEDNATTNSRPGSGEPQYPGVPLGSLLFSEVAEVAGDSDTGQVTKPASQGWAGQERTTST